MASSSVSVESLDRVEADLNSRRFKLKPTKARQSGYSAEDSANDTGDCELNGNQHKIGASIYHGGSSTVPCASVTNPVIDETQDSISKNSPMNRNKAKRPSHFHKGKTAKDKRKLREKRRSTGVVHLPSTESTGDSLDELEDKNPQTSEAKKNTSYNEVIDADNPQTPNEVSRNLCGVRGGNKNKSPSDLEADAEDNQDYDSTVSQSESKFSLSSQSEQQTTNIQSKAPLTQQHVTSPRPRTEFRHATGPTQWSRDREIEDTHSRQAIYVSSRPTASTLSANRFERDNAGLARLSYNLRNIDIDTKSQTEAHLLVKNAELQENLRREKDQNRKLRSENNELRNENADFKEILADKDKKIEMMMKEIHLLNQDLDGIDEENEKIHAENQALIRALSSVRGTDL